MRRAPLQDEPLTGAADDEWVGGADVMIHRQEVAIARMAEFDRLPPSARAVANGLPLPELVQPAIDYGCRTQLDAEEWLRSIVGRSVLG